MLSLISTHATTLAVLVSATQSVPEVTIPSLGVTYQGTLSTSNKIEHFQSIYYAHSTAGQRRFAPPEPYIPPHNSIIDATSPGPACPQMKEPIPPAFDETPSISEDCLHLRIARPVDLTPSSKVPVVVWLHGGGMIKGSAYDSHFDPNRLLELSASIETPIIYAALNYRLTIFGFPSLETLRAEKSMNLGMRDQRVGLEWIRDNIEAFGGDPDRITVYGLSAGGTMASLQLMAFGGDEGVPFQQLWGMSGPPGTALNMSTDAGTLHTFAVAEKVGCGDLSGDQTLECLREVPMQELVDAAMEFSRANHPPSGLFTFIPTVDGNFFPDRPTELVRQGRFTKGIRMIYGWTQDDGAMNVGPAHLIQTEDDMIAPIRNFARLFSPEQYSDLLALYPAVDFEPELLNYEARKKDTDPTVSVHFFRVSRILRDLLFTCSSINFGYEMVKQTRELDPSFDGVRLYALNQSVYNPMLNAMGMPYLGTIHGSDTVYIFNGVFPEGEISKADEDLAMQLSRSLIAFANEGSPVAANSLERRITSWPVSFSQGDSDIRALSADNIIIELVGGVFGTRPINATTSTPSGEWFRGSGDDWLPMYQEFLPDRSDFGSMHVPFTKVVQMLMADENLHERCACIEELSESLGL